MKTASLAVLSLLVLAACESRPGGNETGRADDAVEADDTEFTSDQNKYNSLVTHDTTVDVDVDTISKEGDETVRRDTVQR